MTLPLGSTFLSGNARLAVVGYAESLNQTTNYYGSVTQIFQNDLASASALSLQGRQVAILNPPIQTSEPSTERPLLPLLQKLYTEPQYSCIQRLVSDEGFSIEDQFVPPQFAHKKEQMLSEQNALKGLDPDLIRSPPIELSDLLSTTDKKTIIEAKSGGGKSTLLHYIAYVFSKYFENRGKKLGSWADNFDLVIWISLKELNNSSIGNLLINKNRSFFTGLAAEEIDEFLRNYKGKILYLLDGYNEAVNRDFVDELLLRKDYLIVTSHANVISNGVIGLDTKRFELVGFNEKASEEFVKKLLTSLNQEDRIQPILSLIESSESLQALAKHPLTLELICSSWKPQNGTKLTTISSIAMQMLPGIFNRYYEKKKEEKYFLSYSDLLDHPATEKMLAFYSQVAWKRIFQGSKIFDSALYLPIVRNIHPENKVNFIKQVNSEIGIFKTTGSLLKYPDCHFTHPFFHELFSALYLAKCLKENTSPDGFQSIEEFFQQKTHSSNTTLFMLTVGILQEENNEEVLHRFFDFLIPDMNQASLTQVAIASRCLEEIPIQNPVNRSQILSKLNYFLSDKSLENTTHEKELKEILLGCHLIFYELNNARTLLSNQTKSISLFLMANLRQFFLQQEQAAKENNSYAQFCLGCYYLYHSDSKKAYSYLSLAANGGLAQAQSTLGLMYYQGDGVEKNTQEASRLLTLAANQRFAIAQNNLGVMYYNGEDVEQNKQEAFRLYTLAANQELDAAQTNLGAMYLIGDSIEQNKQEAFRLFTLAANQRFSLAQYNLGVMYYQGNGVEKNTQEAFRLLTLAANQGLALAQNNLSMMHLKGDVIKKNMQEAFRLLTFAANQGLALAQNNLGGMYLRGDGVEPNKKKAVCLFILAANQGLAEAQFNLGVMYQHGEMIAKKNTQEIVRWYQLAADQGHVGAQGNLAEIYQSGADGVEKDLDKAFKYYNLAAKQNSVDALFGLGFCYESGEGTSPDLAIAEKYYSEAIEKGLISMWENRNLFYDDSRKIAVLERLRDSVKIKRQL